MKFFSRAALLILIGFLAAVSATPLLLTSLQQDRWAASADRATGARHMLWQCTDSGWIGEVTTVYNAPEGNPRTPLRYIITCEAPKTRGK